MTSRMSLFSDSFKNEVFILLNEMDQALTKKNITTCKKRKRERGTRVPGVVTSTLESDPGLC